MHPYPKSQKVNSTPSPNGESLNAHTGFLEMSIKLKSVDMLHRSWEFLLPYRKTFIKCVSKQTTNAISYCEPDVWKPWIGRHFYSTFKKSLSTTLKACVSSKDMARERRNTSFRVKILALFFFVNICSITMKFLLRNFIIFRHLVFEAGIATFSLNQLIYMRRF